ncbi:hypothetical protein GL325_03620 [Aeromicrobium sp. 636]|uniref:Integral membrane protein n=1 Tax=Aeromicrobium senzhongii TaxID=2663859 RepID=A0A8I0ESV1_9ACTN|nr:MULTISPECIES: hypothetical protein [Aeromicrobium]MBC9225404.1 hypothetical protein [Aeromicrobium senzhongii]MCQ3997514.1 hypothetical protein [Aeromicrobium sp. 636]MTB87440.1 hypothetical protein [Aeromicrobium senzhongii]QNL95504.1 hypothetical protein H9L21_06210 [Aeromicrobium senzhongii]
MSTHEPPTGPEPQDPDQPVPPPPPSYGSTYPPPPGDGPGAGSGGYPPPPGAGGGYGSGGYPPPPPSGPGYVQPFSATDAIGYGFTKFGSNAGQWLLAGLAIVLVSMAFSVLSWIVQPDDLSDSNPFAALNLGGAVVNLLSTLVGYLITAYVYRGALDETEGRRFTISGIFERVPVGNAILTSLLVSIGVTIGLLLCVVPGIVFAFLSYFALLFVVDRNESPIQAIKSSISLISANVGSSLLLALLSILILIVGICLCFVGLFVAYPVTAIATAYAYKKFQNQPVL